MVFVGSVILFGHSKFAAGEVAQPITLEKAYVRALDVNEQIGIAREDVDLARAEKNRALSYLLPSLETGAHYIRRPDATFSGNGTLTRTEEEHEFNLRLKQPLYTGGRAMATYRNAKENIKASVEQLKIAQEDLLFNVATVFYNVLKARKNLTLAQVEVERLEKHLKASESRFDVGEVTKTVVLRAQAELSRARADLVRSGADLQTARDQLILFTKLPPDFDIVDPPTPFLPPGAEPDLILLAHQKRPDLKASGIQEGIAQNGISYARGSFLPTLSLEGIYSRLYQDPENPFFFVRRDEFATLTLNLPLFEGGLRLAELRQAHSKARQAGLQRAFLEDRVEVEVKTALRDLDTVTSVLENFKDQVAFAQENFTLVEKQFAFGLATNIDVLDANSLLHDAQRQLFNTQYDRDLGILKVQKSVGVFLDHVNPTQDFSP
jgi:outer membrane protein